VEICPSGALDKVGRKMSIDDILEKFYRINLSLILPEEA